jgi:transcriptional regulator with XRE-family HTH domain
MSSQSQDKLENNFVFVAGHRLATLREKNGYGQANFATLIGKSRQTVNNWESKAIIKMDRKDAEAVAATLGTTLQVLTGDKTPNLGVAEPSETYESAEDLRKHIADLRNNLEDLRKNIEDLRRFNVNQEKTITLMEKVEQSQDIVLDKYRRDLKECHESLDKQTQTARK